MPFIPMVIPPPDATNPVRWFIFQNDRMLVRRAGLAVEVPVYQSGQPTGVPPDQAQFFGLLDGNRCCTAFVDREFDDAGDGGTFEPLRKLYTLLSGDMLAAAVRAAHLAHWDRHSRFCGGCGHPTRWSEHERAKVCSRCALTVYPRISPAVIVAVVKDDRILLAHSGRFPGGLRSVLAGFVEPGETLEACVEREVREETGIDIADIAYFGSQPWPFPDSLMVAFTARYAGGEIRVDGVEVTEAGWFAADGLPPVPDKISISRRLIDWFVERHRR
jgi:NAD+ diphosphatase